MTESFTSSAPIFAEHPTTVARALIGMIIRVRKTTGRIVETEAYTGPPEDLASHAHTRTNSAGEIMKTAGRIYIYSIHGGIATNITCGEGEHGAVLLRAIEPVTGIPEMIKRRSKKGTKISQTWDSDDMRSLTTMTNGPNKLTAALGIIKAWNDTPIGQNILLFAGDTPGNIVTTERIGISESVEHQWRYCDAESDFLS